MSFRGTRTILFLLAVGTPGAVSADDLKVTVKDVCGRVLPGATVSVAGDSPTQQGKSDASGAYLFHAVAGGSPVVTVELRGFQKQQQAVSAPEGNGEWTVNVRLRRDWTIRETINVSDGPPRDGYELYGIEGVIRGPDARPVAGATVYLRTDPSHREREDTCTTDSSGRYEVVAFAPDSPRWQVSVAAKDLENYELRDIALIAWRVSNVDFQLRPR